MKGEERKGAFVCLTVCMDKVTYQNRLWRLQS